MQEPYVGTPFEWVVESLEPENRAVFRWHPFAMDEAVDYSREPMTRIEFALEPVDEGTRLTITESGFEAIPAERREKAYRDDQPPPNLRGRTVILVDDGLATGSTMRAAVAAVRQLGPMRVVVAVPVAALDACEEFQAHVDEVICAFTPEPFHAVGIWYEDFAQTSDTEVRELLERAAHVSAA